MSEKKGIDREQIVEKIEAKEKLSDEFLVLLANGKVHEARNVIKKAKEDDIELAFSDKKYQDAIQKAIEDSFKRGHVRHATRLLEFSSNNKILIDLSTREIAQALSEGFEGCGPQKKEEILEFAKRNRIEIDT